MYAPPAGSGTTVFSAQGTNKVLAGPVSGDPAVPAFRALDVGDIPDLSGLYVGLIGGVAQIAGPLEVGDLEGQTFTPKFQVSPSDGRFFADGGSIISDGTGHLTLIDVVATVAEISNTVLVGSTLGVQSVSSGAGIAFGDVNNEVTGTVFTIGNGTFTFAGGDVDLSGTIHASNFSGSSAGTNTGDQTITLTGGVTGSGTGSFATIVVTNANLTGPVTSVGNATSVASQTGSGSTFAMSVSPSLSGTPAAPTAASNTNTTQLATCAFVTSAVSTALTGALKFKGSIDCSGSPNYPAAAQGDTYKVSVAGKIGGASGTGVDTSDWIAATADNAGGTQAAVGTSWTSWEHNLQGALLSSNNLSDVQSASTALANLGGVPTTRTVNGSALSGNVTITTISGNAGTATALQTPRAINGTNFDGTGAITVAAAAGTLTGSTLASGVTASSLTSLGILTSNLLLGSGVILKSGVAGQGCSMTLAGNANNGCDTFYAAGGLFRTTEISLAGTNDVYFQAVPATSAGFGILEAYSSAGLIVGTGGNANPIIFKVNRTEVARVDASNLTLADGIGVAAGTTTGTKIGTATNQKIGLWNAAPVVQPSTTGTTTGFTAGTGTTVASGSTFTGNTGSTAYTIGDIINALKKIGLLAS